MNYKNCSIIEFVEEINQWLNDFCYELERQRGEYTKGEKHFSEWFIHWSMFCGAKLADKLWRM